MLLLVLMHTVISSGSSEWWTLLAQGRSLFIHYYLFIYLIFFFQYWEYTVKCNKTLKNMIAWRCIICSRSIYLQCSIQLLLLFFLLSRTYLKSINSLIQVMYINYISHFRDNEDWYLLVLLFPPLQRIFSVPDCDYSGRQVVNRHWIKAPSPASTAQATQAPAACSDPRNYSL